MVVVRPIQAAAAENQFRDKMTSTAAELTARVEKLKLAEKAGREQKEKERADALKDMNVSSDICSFLFIFACSHTATEWETENV